MNSSILNKMGLGNFDIGYILIGLIVILIILIVLVIIQINKFSKLNKKYNKFMQGKTAKSLETDIMALYEDNKFIKTAIDKSKKDIRILYNNMESVFQKMGLVKYDAFNQMGGKLSFSLALLDENNNGFILNSVHSTEGCYSYTKEITAGESAILLGEEEKQALNIAMRTNND